MAPHSPSPPDSPSRPVLVSARELLVRLPHTRLFDGLSFNIAPGLTLIRGGDGRGKTTLLRLLAGSQQPNQGRIECQAASVFWVDPAGSRSEDDQLTMRQWLQAQRDQHPAWEEAAAKSLAESFALDEHLDKGLFMLSTGTRRKAHLVAGMASGAQLTLLDTPFAALDARSRAIVADLLHEAAGHPRRAFVVADFELPPGLAPEQLAGWVDLGD